MQPIKWHDTLNLGIKEVDDQHKCLVSMVNLYIVALQKKKDHVVLKDILKRLREYTIQHFRDEEAYMERVGYPRLAEHRAEHEKLVAQVKGYLRDTFHGQVVPPAQFVDFLKGWLVDHIVHTDMDIGTFVRGGAPRS